MQGANGANVIFIAVMLLLLVIAFNVFFIGLNQSSPAEDPAIVSDAVSEEPSIVSDAVNEDPLGSKCREDVETKSWDTASVYCAAAAEQGDAGAQKLLYEVQVARKLQAIPEQFLGEWNNDPQACGTGLSDGRLQIYADRLGFYESTGYVKSLKLINPQTVRVELSYTGEGSTWNDTKTLILSGSGRDLKVDDFWRSKC